jgi:transcriptional regulator GlxA family with amidase domain
VEELDWAGPWEVLGFWATNWPDDNVELFSVARDNSRLIGCVNGARIQADYSWDDAPPIDVLVYPGGDTRAALGDKAVRQWVRDVAGRARLVASVCTGALVLADAGLLENLPATTHWSAFDRLLAMDKTIDVRRDERFVDAGKIVSAAGVSAGIDMALHLVARLHSVERAREVRHGIQYDPAPPV